MDNKEIYLVIETKEKTSKFNIEDVATRVCVACSNRIIAVRRAKRIIKRARKKYKLYDLYNTRSLFKDSNCVVSSKSNGFSDNFTYTIEIRNTKLV